MVATQSSPPVGDSVVAGAARRFVGVFQRVHIRSFEAGLLFRSDEFVRLLEPGVYWFFDPLGRVRVDVVSQRTPILQHDQLDVIVKSGTLAGKAVVVDLKDHERALVWVDGRFHAILYAGRYAFWNTFKEVRVETVDARNVRFEHEQFKTIVRWPLASRCLDVASVQRDRAGVLFIDGRCVDVLQPGEYAFWKGPADAKIVEVDLRETMVEVGGQELMTADKVTLRLNAVVVYRVEDPRKAVSRSEDYRASLYREAQLVLRTAVGARDLDSFLSDKDATAQTIEEGVRRRAAELGLSIASVGIRDVILPGDMKELMNRVIQARKAAEADLISRREETAAIRSQANTAKLLAETPLLMRLRELEVLEKIAASGKLNVILGEKGLADRVVNLL